MLLADTPYIEKNKLQYALDNASATISRNIIKFQDFSPLEYAYDGIYKYSNTGETFEWKSGFWNGLVWLLYEYSHLENIKCYGEKITEALCVSFEKEGLTCSDLGLLIIPSCVANYHFTHSRIAKETIITAADSLLTKYHNTSNIICSFDEELEEDYITCKISNLLNVQLLMCAYKITDNTKYLDIAEKNVELIIKYNIQPDGKSFFRSYFDRTSGKLLPRESIDYQFKFLDDGTSCRCYAWALYGLSILYNTTGEQFYYDKFSKVFDYWEKYNPSSVVYKQLENNHDDNICDNLSAAIIANALCTVCRTNKSFGKKYLKKAGGILNTLIDSYTPQTTKMCEGLLDLYYDSTFTTNHLHYSLMGDYFYYEALMNSMFDRKSFWYETEAKKDVYAK